MTASKVNPTIDLKDAAILWNPDTRDFEITHWADASFRIYSGLVDAESMSDVERVREAWVKMDHAERLGRLITDVLHIHARYGVPLDHMRSELLKIRGAIDLQ